MPKLTKELLLSLSETDQITAVIKEYNKCRKDAKYCIETYFTVVDKLGNRSPFKLYPHQIEALISYQKFSNNITMKTRQMGFTTFTAAYILWKMIFNNNYLIDIISKSQKDSAKFIKDIRGILYEVTQNFPWLCESILVDNVMKLGLDNGSEVYGESTTEDAGRGNTYDMVCVDESHEFNTLIKIRNKRTGEIKEIAVGEFYLQSKKNNSNV